jgi:Cof subfamily protein (haloacid dehalogenase superfamily)
MIRLIALDLDGTLLGPDFRVADEDSAAVAAAIERGVHVVIVTSRWYGLAQRTARRLSLTAPIVAYNGAHVREPDDGEELFHVTVPVEPAREIAAFCDEGGWETYVTVDGVTYMRSRWDDSIDPARLPKDMRPTKKHAEFVTGPATGIMVFSEEGVRAVLDNFADRYDGALVFPEGRSESLSPYITITASGVDKASGLRLVCERLNVPLEEVMAVGDTAQDLPMLEAAGLGVAMGNAPDDVKSRVDAVTSSNTEGGVGKAIWKHVLS